MNVTKYVDPALLMAKDMKEKEESNSKVTLKFIV
jgi:hypothetical protein